MRFELKLAGRYLRSKRRSLARLTSAVGVLGIAAGVAALIVAQAVGTGVASEFRDRLLAREPHVRVSASDKSAIEDWKARAAQLRAVEGVAEVVPAAADHALLTTPSRTSYALVTALETDRAPEVRVGIRLARDLGLAIGERVEIVAADSPKPLAVTVGGFLETGIHDFDAVIVELPAAHYAALKGRPAFLPQSLAVRVRDPDAAPSVAARIKGELGNAFEVVDWQAANRPLFAAIGLERRAASVVISLILVIAALSITATLAVLVNERRLDIAVLRTCGARARSIVLVFFLEGVALGAAGVAAGIAVGLGICAAVNRFGLFSLDPQVYSVGRVDLVASPSSVLLISVFAMSVAAAASFYPALRAARVKPLENLRRI